MYTLKRPTS